MRHLEVMHRNFGVDVAPFSLCVYPVRNKTAEFLAGVTLGALNAGGALRPRPLTHESQSQGGHHPTCTIT